MVRKRDLEYRLALLEQACSQYAHSGNSSTFKKAYHDRGEKVPWTPHQASPLILRPKSRWQKLVTFFATPRKEGSRS